MTDYSLADHQIYRRRMLAEIRRLRSVIAALANERDEWKERWAAERADHEASIKHFDRVMNEERI